MQVRSFHPPVTNRFSGPTGPQNKPPADKQPEGPSDTVLFETTGLGTVALAATILAPALGGAALGGARLAAAGGLLGFVGAGFASYAMYRQAETQYAQDKTGTLFMQPCRPDDPDHRIPPGIHGLS